MTPSITVLAATSPLHPCSSNYIYLVSIWLGEVQLTPRFTSFHIKASPSQLQKHLWNVCCCFFFTSSGILGFCERLYESPCALCETVCVLVTANSVPLGLHTFSCGISKWQRNNYMVNMAWSENILSVVGELWPLTLAITHVYIYSNAQSCGRYTSL